MMDEVAPLDHFSKDYLMGTAATTADTTTTTPKKRDVFNSLKNILLRTTTVLVFIAADATRWTILLHPRRFHRDT